MFEFLKRLSIYPFFLSASNSLKKTEAIYWIKKQRDQRMQPNKVSHPHLGSYQCFRLHRLETISFRGQFSVRGWKVTIVTGWSHNNSRYIISILIFNGSLNRILVRILQCFLGRARLVSKHGRGENGPFGPDLIGGPLEIFCTCCVLRVWWIS